MKRWKKIVVPLLTACLLSNLLLVNVLAAGSEGYTYTVTLSAGNKGTINGTDKKVISDLQNGSRVTLHINDIQVTDSKYYVKGFRLSGRDNKDEEALAPPSFTVTGDVDYVVAYGIRGNMVAYTVRYLDASGNELAASNTFYGSVGDKPVVAYQYIDNYVPQALALTKTLQANEAENVFEFIYTPGDPGTVTEVPNITTIVVPGAVNTVYEDIPGGTADANTGGTADANTGGTADANAGGTADANAGGTADANAGGTADANAGGTADADNTGGTDETQGQALEGADEQVPQDLINLDDEEVPKADIDNSAEASSKKMPIVAGIAIAVVSLAAVAGLLVFLKKRSK